MTAKAAKEAEARVRQETEALVKKLQDEVAEKAAQVVTKSSQIEVSVKLKPFHSNVLKSNAIFPLVILVARKRAS